MKTLVAYFSASGNTASLAKRVAEAAKADLFEIKPVEPYTDADLRWTNPLARCNKEKIGRKNVPIADRVKDFDEYVRRGMELTIFWGNTFLRRGDYEGPVAFIDTSVLRQLLSYKRKFHSEGLSDLEENADIHIDEWCRQIECEMGFTRQFMWYQVDLQWRNYKEGMWTVDQLSEWSKRYAKGLVQLGYTPKWLSEFDDLSEAVK